MAKGSFDCPICLDFYSDVPEEDFFVSTDCGVIGGSKVGHVFHNHCLWNSLTYDETGILRCPICRANIELDDCTKLHGIDIQPKPDENVFDHELKVVVLGRFRAGKSCIVKRFSRNTFEDQHLETKGVDYFVKSIRMGDKRIKLNLWDTGGQEKYHSLVSGYVRDAFGMIFVYDVTDADTFDDIMHWVHFADDYGPLNTRRILVGNKIDLEAQRQVPTEKGKEIANRLGYSFLECSAKECYNIPEIFRTLTAEMMNEPSILADADKILSSFRIREELMKLDRTERIKVACCN